MSKVKLLLYCTKAKPYLVHVKEYSALSFSGEIDCGYELRKSIKEVVQELNGKIVAECDCDKVEEIACRCVPYRNKNNLGYELFIDNGVYKVEWNENNLDSEEPKTYKEEAVVFERSDRYIDTMFKNSDLQKMCLSPQELLDYIKLGNNGYAIHLSNLNIFDEPKELNEYYYSRPKKVNSFNGPTMVIESIDKAPQNMCRVLDEKENEYILISIRPEWLCKILNGEKTIEVRKQIVKELKEMIEK